MPDPTLLSETLAKAQALYEKAKSDPAGIQAAVAQLKSALDQVQGFIASISTLSKAPDAPTASADAAAAEQLQKWADVVTVRNAAADEAAATKADAGKWTASDFIGVGEQALSFLAELLKILAMFGIAL